MGFLMVAACALAGLILGIASGISGSLGLVAGLGIGLALRHLKQLGARIDALRDEVRALQQALAAGAPRRAPSADSASAAVAVAATDSLPPATQSGRPVTVTPPPPVDAAPAAPARIPAAAPIGPATPAAQAAPDLVTRVGAALKRFFSEGNVPVKVGMLVLFAGVAALLKYVADEGWLRLPLELRLAGIALAAIAALAFGWSQRGRRPSFALSLQGGAIGVLLLTVFAAFRLYQLLPAGLAFALMLVLVAGTGVLAVLQDARALAVLGILAGFAAPILIATGSGDHVVLFSYYSVLNLAIFAIAWRKPWRALNLLGFFFTFAIGTAWGVLRYDSTLWASTEPFLLLNFAIYLAIPILYARRREVAARDLVDGTLVFGNPLLAFALQAALLDGARLPLAYCALGLAALYAALAWHLLPRRRVLGESFAVLAIGFATLAVPLALSARVSACTFALEGAALVWLGLRQGRRLPQLSGLTLQALAGAAFVLANAFTGSAGAVPIANGVFVSALLIAGAAFASAALYRHHARAPTLALVVYLWGLGWWLGAASNEINSWVAAPLQLHALLALSAVTAALAARAHRRWRDRATAWTCALALAGGVLLVPLYAAGDVRVFGPWGLAALAVYAACGWWTLAALRQTLDAASRVAQLGLCWTLILTVALGLSQLGGDARLGSGWIDALSLLPLLAVWTLATRKPTWLAPTSAQHTADHRTALLASLAAVAALGFIALLWHAGDSAPLPYLPLLNPLDLVQLGVLACAARWLAGPAVPGKLAERRPLLLAAGGVAFLTAATLRGVHQLGGVPWDDALWSSSLAQAALTVVWSTLGVLGWVLGSRRGQRTLWLAGAALMAVVLVKLLLIDRGQLGNLFGIGSFIAYGLLCSLIGYLAPAPPRTTPGASS